MSVAVGGQRCYLLGSLIPPRPSTFTVSGRTAWGKRSEQEVSDANLEMYRRRVHDLGWINQEHFPGIKGRLRGGRRSGSG